MILTKEQIGKIDKAHKEWLNTVQSKLPEEINSRGKAAKEMNDLFEEAGLFNGRSFNAEQLCRSMKIQKIVHNINPIILPKFLGNFNYNKYFKGFKGSTKDFKKQHPELQGPGETGLGYPGVDVKEFSVSLQNLFTFKGNEFLLSAEKLLSFEGVGPAIFSGYLYLFSPDKFPLVNGASIGGIEKLISITNGQKQEAAKQGKENLGITRTTKGKLANFISWFYLLSEIKDNLGVENFHELDWFTWNIGKADKKKQYWQIAPGEKAVLWDNLLGNSIAAIGYSSLNVNLAGKPENELKELFNEKYPTFSEHKAKVKFKQLWDFLSLKPGDKIVTNKGKQLLLAIGVIKGNYKFRPDRKEYKHTIDVEYQKVSDQGIQIPEDFKGKFGKTIIPLKKPEFDILEALFTENGPYETNEWIFQGNQKYFDIEGALTSLENLTWEVNQHKDKIKTGGTVYIWQSGLKAGIVASGEILDQPKAIPMQELEKPFIKSPERFKEEALRVPIRIDRVLKEPILKEKLLNQPILSGITILKSPYGSNFPLTADQAASLKELLQPNSISPLNQILYGPPGTGKTYQTVNYALSIIEKRPVNELIEEESSEGRAKLLTRFQEYKDNGQIQFITFHQNYAYEDFIQGLRPVVKGADGTLAFELNDGVFKLIADRALDNYKASVGSKLRLQGKPTFKRVFEDYFQKLNEGEVESVKIKMKKAAYSITEIGNKSISFTKQSGGTGHTLSISTLSEMYEQETYSPKSKGGLSVYYRPLLNELLSYAKKIGSKKYATEELNSFVIIIDEINRANISRVFGELITLIEDDKRYGQLNEMKATLPSGEPFSVPSNLYVIGTMNTADKSIALIDIALRRRFEFIKLYPEIDLVEDSHKALFQTINEQIIELKGPDFQIGHAYFMKKPGQEYQLEAIMNKRVIPLLYEYFMNDGETVNSILTKAKVKTINRYGLFEFESYSNEQSS